MFVGATTKGRGLFAGIAALSALLISLIHGAVYSQDTLPSSPSRTGILVLDVTPPDAILTLDGEKIGPVGNFRKELSAGPHEIEISADGYEPTKQKVTIVAGETFRIPLRLAAIPPPPSPAPEKATLVLEVTPPSAILRIDGKPVGRANGYRQELSAGSHLVEILASGYRPSRMTMSLTAGETRPVRLKLARIAPPKPLQPGRNAVGSAYGDSGAETAWQRRSPQYENHRGGPGYGGRLNWLPGATGLLGVLPMLGGGTSWPSGEQVPARSESAPSAPGYQPYPGSAPPQTQPGRPWNEASPSGPTWQTQPGPEPSGEPAATAPNSSASSSIRPPTRTSHPPPGKVAGNRHPIIYPPRKPPVPTPQPIDPPSNPQPAAALATIADAPAAVPSAAAPPPEPPAPRGLTAGGIGRPVDTGCPGWPFPTLPCTEQFPAPRNELPAAAGQNQLAQMRLLGRQLQQLPKGKIYLSAPVEMKVSEKRLVAARVGINVPDDVLRGDNRAGDQSTEGALRISHQMIATLTGPGFAITPTTPEKQAVAEGFPTVWEWTIEANVEGAQDLEATLYALVPDSASSTARQRIDSYTQQVKVSVKPQTWSEWLTSAREEIDAVKALLIALASILTLALGWLGISVNRRRRPLPATARKNRPSSKSTRSSKPRRSTGGAAIVENNEPAPGATETSDQQLADEPHLSTT